MEKIKDTITDVLGEATGATVGTGLGMMIGGPAGAIAGAAIGAVISNIGSDYLSRLLSKKEKQRIDYVREATVRKISENESEGKSLRDDDFFLNTVNDRSTAEEIYEGILLAAQREYEERKIEFLGRLYANIAYDSSIHKGIANALLKEATDLTYRQLKIIKSVGVLQIGATKGFDRRRNNTSTITSGLTNVSIASDITTLYRKTIIHSSHVIFDAANINPSQLTLVGHGALLFSLMELEKTEIDDVEMEIMHFLTHSSQ